MGEALDRLTAQMEAADTGTVVPIQRHAPDHFFTAAQHGRMENLRLRRDSLTFAERIEWEELVHAERDTTISRTDAVINQIGAGIPIALGTISVRENRLSMMSESMILPQA